MPRKYERKTDRDTQLKAQLAVKELRSILDTGATLDGKRVPSLFGRNIKFDDAFETTFHRLTWWLRALREQPVAYSALLQVWLEEWCDVPAGVFADDVLQSVRRGRPSTDLGRKAFRLYKPRIYGWAQVAKKLMPDKYKANPTTAVKAVREALAAYRKRRETHHSDDVRMLAHRMLGIADDEDLNGD